MKSVLNFLLLFLAFSITATYSCAQTLEDFFHHQGSAHLLNAAHPSNDYLHGRHYIYKDYIDVSLTSKDNVLGGDVYTDLRIIRGNSDLYFADILILNDTDPFAKPFDALGAEAQFIMQLYKSLDQQTYNKLLADIQNAFHTDVEHWTGKMWAVFGLNVDYYGFMLTQK